MPELREALRRAPDDPASYFSLSAAYLSLNRFDEVRSTIEEVRGRKIENLGLHLMLYALAFFEGNAAAMKQQVDWATGQSGREDAMFSTVATRKTPGESDLGGAVQCGSRIETAREPTTQSLLLSVPTMVR